MRFFLITLTVLFLSACAGMHPPKAALSAGAATIDEIPERRMHFPTGSDVMAKRDMPRLASNIKWMRENPGEVIVIEGHCDERGGDGLNMELGDRRARSIKALIMHEGVNEERMIMIVSKGEREPIDPRHIPDAWKKNRRVEFMAR